MESLDLEMVESSMEARRKGSASTAAADLFPFCERDVWEESWVDEGDNTNQKPGF